MHRRQGSTRAALTGNGLMGQGCFAVMCAVSVVFCVWL